MQITEGRENFYKRTGVWVPDNVGKEFAPFHVCYLKTGKVGFHHPLHFGRKDHFKIALIEGTGKFLYADREVTINNYSIIFLNHLVPYGPIHGKLIRAGMVCVIREAFLYQYENINNYTVFQPGNNVYELSKEQFTQLKSIYQRMFEETESDYIYKDDLLRTLLYELVHYTLKMKPHSTLNKLAINASVRISTLFTELLERQFPINHASKSLTLRSASEFAKHLNVHVNHLNRALKSNLDRTTSQLIIDRTLQEAKVLLIESDWTVSEIAYALGYSQVPHFNKLFKKYFGMTPMSCRRNSSV